MFKKMNLIVIAAVLVSIFITLSCSGNQQEPAPLTKEIIRTGGSVADAPYSPGVLTGNTLYCSGRLGTNPATGKLGKDIAEQTTFALESIKAILNDAGMDMSDVVNVNVFLKNLEDFGAMNQAYKVFFPTDAPARATVQVAGIVNNGLVEISCIAVKTQ